MREMGLCKKLGRRGFRFRLPDPRVTPPSEQLDLFGYQEFYYEQGRMLYVSPSKDESKPQQTAVQPCCPVDSPPECA